VFAAPGFSFGTSQMAIGLTTKTNVSLALRIPLGWLGGSPVIWRNVPGLLVLA
jgi:hypothetical protein